MFSSNVVFLMFLGCMFSVLMFYALCSNILHMLCFNIVHVMRSKGVCDVFLWQAECRDLKGTTFSG